MKLVISPGAGDVPERRLYIRDSHSAVALPQRHGLDDMRSLYSLWQGEGGEGVLETAASSRFKRQRPH